MGLENKLNIFIAEKFDDEGLLVPTLYWFNGTLFSACDDEGADIICNAIEEYTGYKVIVSGSATGEEFSFDITGDLL